MLPFGLYNWCLFNVLYATNNYTNYIILIVEVWRDLYLQLLKNTALQKTTCVEYRFIIQAPTYFILCFLIKRTLHGGDALI